ncbi:MAG: glycosyltransferase family 4 protein [Lachnospiraceae bacterium]|nr:glycosyltransferase family 4 protein [Lachnospiraceae bacterium]
MKIAITTVQIPFVSGGAEYHAQNLRNALIRNGHEAEIITMPFNDNPDYMLENYIIASRLMDVRSSWGGVHDLCIGMKFPAYFMPHPNKVIWALHQHRQVYDLFDTQYSSIKNDVRGRELKKIVTNADNKYIREAKRVYANSYNVAARMKKYNNIDSTPLYHPCPDMEKFYCGESEDYVLMPSRINDTKRQKLAVEALAKTKSDIKLYLVGRADNPVVMEDLKKYISEMKIENRVKFFDFVSQEEKFKLYANARAVLFVPVDEDYGYITLEAMASSKPVITAKDSGGPLEFVEDDKTGFICDPTPESVAEAIDKVAKSQKMSIEYGIAGKTRIDEMNINWDYVVKELTK